MKLRNKLLTVLPLTIGAMAPIICVTSCSKGSLTLNFADAVNCLNSKDSSIAKYYKIGKVSDAAKEHIYVVEETTTTPIGWANSNIIQQQFYWDLVYSCSYYNVPFMLKWAYNENDVHKLLNTGTFYLKADTPISFKSMKYEKDSNNKYRIKLVGDTVTDVCQSYIYSKI